MTVTTVPDVLVAEVVVERVERLSPSFVRVTFAGESLRDLATTERFDTRFKIIFPGPTGLLPTLWRSADDWRQSWQAMPDGARAPMRTYTIREIDARSDEVRLITDLVVHEDGSDLGPACRWALAAAPGDVVQIIGPHRMAQAYGGAEFDPGPCREVLLAGDETAVPAILRILADADPGLRGHAFIEVPEQGDIQPGRHPGVEVIWLPRGRHTAPGRCLVRAVRAHLGLPPLVAGEPLPELASSLDVEVWETPRFSSSGESLAATPVADPAALGEAYAWIAGESWSVKALRRTLVSEVGMDRRRVAFMGYWRQGVAMRS